MKEAIRRGDYGLSGGPAGAVYSSSHRDASNARAIGSATQGVEIRPPGADAFGAIELAHNCASSLASRIIELAEILCGQDVSPAGVVGAKLPSGLLPALEERTNDLCAHLNAAHDAITRIRNHLPS